MGPFNKKYLVLLSSFLLLTLTGCPGKTPPKKQAEEGKAIMQKAVEIIVDQNTEKIGLLSRKYNLELAKTRNILMDYMTFRINSFQGTSEPQKNLQNQVNFLDAMSKKYEVAIDKLASLILDYQSVASKP
jgi:hypothetical protein